MTPGPKGRAHAEPLEWTRRASQTRPRQPPTVAVFVGDLQERPSSQLRNSQNLQGQAFAQFDNDVRSKRTRGGTRAALELKRWTFLAALGYLNAARSTGRSLVPGSGR